MPKDSQLISKQKHEVEFIHARYKVPKKVIREVIDEVGISRAKVYDVLRLWGYDMPVKRVKVYYLVAEVPL